MKPREGYQEYIKKINMQLEKTIFSPTFEDYFTICIMFFTFMIYYYSLNLSMLPYNSSIELLSTSISSLVSILTISFTLSLLIIQYATEKYSIKLIGYYIKDKLFWLLLIQYLFSIIFNLIVLSFFNKVRILVDISLFLTIYCFILIIPQTVNIANSIQPEKLIKNLLEQSKKRIISEGKIGDFRSMKNPIRQLFEFSKSMIINDEYNTLNKILSNIDTFVLVKEEKDVDMNIIENVTYYYYMLFNYSVLVKKEEICENIINNYSLLYRTICERNYSLDKVRNFDRIYDNMFNIAINKKLDNVVYAYIKSNKEICMIKIKFYLPNQDKILFYKENITEILEDDKNNDFKYMDFEHNINLFDKIADYSLKYKIYENIGDILYANYEILSEMIKSDKGEKLCFTIAMQNFYSLSKYCYECIDNNSDHFYYTFSLYIGSIKENNKYKFWLNEVTNLICNVGLYQTECGKGNYHSYWHIGYLGRVIAPEEIVTLKHIVEILVKIANYEIKNILSDKTTLYSSYHKMYISEIINIIENLKTWKNQQNKEYINYVDKILIDLKENYTQKKADYII